jgi:hypothetical protein
VLDDPCAHDERQAPEQDQTRDLERRQPQGARQLETRVAEQLVGQVDALGELALVGRRLAADPVHVGSEPAELLVVVAERTRLRCTSSRTRDLVPARGGWLIGSAGARVDVEDPPPRLAELGKIDPAPACALQLERWQARAR